MEKKIIYISVCSGAHYSNVDKGGTSVWKLNQIYNHSLGTRDLMACTVLANLPNYSFLDVPTDGGVYIQPTISNTIAKDVPHSQMNVHKLASQLHTQPWKLWPFSLLLQNFSNLSTFNNIRHHNFICKLSLMLAYFSFYKYIYYPFFFYFLLLFLLVCGLLHHCTNINLSPIYK